MITKQKAIIGVLNLGLKDTDTEVLLDIVEKDVSSIPSLLGNPKLARRVVQMWKGEETEAKLPASEPSVLEELDEVVLPADAPSVLLPAEDGEQATRAHAARRKTPETLYPFDVAEMAALKQQLTKPNPWWKAPLHPTRIFDTWQEGSCLVIEFAGIQTLMPVFISYFGTSSRDTREARWPATTHFTREQADSHERADVLKVARLVLYRLWCAMSNRLTARLPSGSAVTVFSTEQCMRMLIEMGQQRVNIYDFPVRLVGYAPATAGTVEGWWVGVLARETATESLGHRLPATPTGEARPKDKRKAGERVALPGPVKLYTPLHAVPSQRGLSRFRNTP